MSRRFVPSSLLRAALFAASAGLLAAPVLALDEGPAEEPPAAPAPPKPEPKQPAAPAPVEPPIPPAEVGGTPEPPPAPAAPAPPEGKPKSGIWPKRHRLELVAGYHFGNGVRDAGILAAPITGQPGARDYPAATPLNVELDDSEIYGIRYAYFPGAKWGIGVALEHLQSQILDPDPDNLAVDQAELALSNLSPDLQALLLARLAAHQQPHDMNVTFFDVSGIHVFNPRKRWPVEFGGGIGWAFASMDGRVAYEKLVVSDRLEGANDPIVIANDVLDPPPPFGQCLADNDPCIELRAHDGLTWNAFMNVGYAFTPAIALRFGTKFRYIEQLTDPGDSNVSTEATLGLSFSFGGE